MFFKRLYDLRKDSYIANEQAIHTRPVGCKASGFGLRCYKECFGKNWGRAKTFISGWNSGFKRDFKSFLWWNFRVAPFWGQIRCYFLKGISGIKIKADVILYRNKKENHELNLAKFWKGLNSPPGTRNHCKQWFRRSNAQAHPISYNNLGKQTQRTYLLVCPLCLAPRAGLEPATSWLTVMRSTDWANEEY